MFEQIILVLSWLMWPVLAITLVDDWFLRLPTLRDGDFILVNKFSYGLRLPVLNRKILSLSLPERGDVVVFRSPRDPAVNYIKRVVGLPGDRVKVENDRVYVNGEPLPETEAGRYSDGCYVNMRLSEVQTGKHRHNVLSCRTSDPLANFVPLPGCDRRIRRSYPCEEDPQLMAQPGVVDRGDEGETLVPAGNYLMIGDNRDNSVDGRYLSADGRTWGFVPEANLVGSAKRVWFNFDWDRRWKKLTDWSRIGERID